MNAALVISLVLLLCGYAMRRTEGSWVAPAPFWILLWSSYLFCAALVFPNLDALTTAALYIVAASAAFSLGSFIGYRELGQSTPLTPGSLRDALPGLPGMVLIAIAASLLNLSMLFSRFGAGVSGIFDSQTVLRVIISARSQNYAGAGEITRIEWLCLLLVYIGAFAGGALFRLRARRSDAVLGIAGLLAASLVLGMIGSRMGALYGGAFWVAAYLATATASAPTLRQLERGALAGAVVTGGLGILGVSILVMAVRYATNFAAVGWRVVLADAFGFVGAFGIWLDERGLVGTGLTAGARSLTRLVQVAGIREAPLSTIAVDFTASNIYTILRDLIEDFGTFGSLVVLAAVGWIGRRAFEWARRGSLIAVAVLLAIGVFTLTSFAVGVFFYTATTLALAGALGYLAWAADRRRRLAGRVAPTIGAQPEIVSDHP